MGILPPIDSVTATIDEPEVLAAEVEHARRLGFGGKLCIHPNQVETVNRGFSPTEAEVGWAERVLEAVGATSGGAARLDGEMIDRPVIERAHSVLRRAAGVKD